MMSSKTSGMLLGCLLMLSHGEAGSLLAQSTPDLSGGLSGAPAKLNLTLDQQSQLKGSLVRHDYVGAETLLLERIRQAPHPPEVASLLAYLGSVYFLAHDPLNAAIAWKKSDAIVPLPSDLRFSRAMAYLQMNHPDWARTEIESLARENKTNALYVYWLGRLDYDAHLYPSAIEHFQRSIQLDPKLSKAYDKLGLCYFYENRNELAIENFQKAIALDRQAGDASAWPYLDLAETQRFVNRLDIAESNAREAIRLAPQLVEAHDCLGKVLEAQGHLETAAAEFSEAIRIDKRHAESHIALAQVYRKMGNKEAAQSEIEAYRSLRADSLQNGSSQPPGVR